MKELKKMDEKCYNSLFWNWDTEDTEAAIVAFEEFLRVSENFDQNKDRSFENYFPSRSQTEMVISPSTWFVENRME